MNPPMLEPAPTATSQHLGGKYLTSARGEESFAVQFRQARELSRLRFLLQVGLRDPARLPIDLCKANAGTGFGTGIGPRRRRLPAAGRVVPVPAESSTKTLPDSIG